MKKSRVAGAALIAALVVILFAVRRQQRSVAGTSPDQPEQSTSATAKTPMSRDPGPRAPAGVTLGASLSPELFAQVAKPAVDAPKKPSEWDVGRDWYWDKLLLSQGRDAAKEQQIAAKMMAAFGNRSDTLVGSTSCSPQVCRVELRGIGTVDYRLNWQPDVIFAVEPKGFKFFVVEEDADGNTVMNYYFGRHASWGVPDFHALGML